MHFKANGIDLRLIAKNMQNIPLVNHSSQIHSEMAETLIIIQGQGNQEAELALLFAKHYQHAKERNIDCTLSFKRYKQLKKVKKCFYSGVDITPENFSLDRIDNDGIYSDNNVVVCDLELNKIKNNLTKQQIKWIYDGLKKKGLFKLKKI